MITSVTPCQKVVAYNFCENGINNGQATSCQLITTLSFFEYSILKYVAESSLHDVSINQRTYSIYEKLQQLGLIELRYTEYRHIRTAYASKLCLIK